MWKVWHCMLGLHMMGMHLWLCRRVNLTPLPPALMSSIHDGFHTTSGKAGPTISNCRFVGAGKCTESSDCSRVNEFGRAESMWLSLGGSFCIHAFSSLGAACTEALIGL